MMYRVCIFVPPLYFAMRKCWGAFMFNAIVYGFSCLFWLSALLLGFTAILGLLLWFVSASHALWSLRKELVVEAAEVMATKMVDKLRQQQPLPPLSPSRTR